MLVRNATSSVFCELWATPGSVTSVKSLPIDFQVPSRDSLT